MSEAPVNPFIEDVFEKLRRHPKRVVFPEGTHQRVLHAARRYVDLKLGPAVLLGDRQEVEEEAEKVGVSLDRMLVIHPEQGSDLDFFIENLQGLPRYKGIEAEDARKILINPNYFASMMLRNGQCDGLVSGVSEFSGNILRPLFQLIKPLPGVRSISSCMIMISDRKELGDEGVLFMADAGVIPNPTVEQLAGISLETAKLRRQLTGKTPRVAMLSYSSKGSAQTRDTEKISDATELVLQRIREEELDIQVDGELQVDAALIPEVGKRKAPGSEVAGRADVLVFPDLNSGNISTKLVQALTHCQAYGQILTGLSKPAAEVSRGASVEDIVGVAAVVALQAIEYRKLYPETQGQE